MRDFYDEVSYGNFTYIPGAVLGWYASSYSTWHWDNEAVDDSADCRDVVYEAIQLADADFDFSGYDDNSDGTVTNDELTIFIIVSGNVGGAFHWYTVGTSGSLGPGPGSPTCDGKAIEASSTQHTKTGTSEATVTSWVTISACPTFMIPMVVPRA